MTGSSCHMLMLAAAAAVKMGVRVQRKMEGDGGHGRIVAWKEEKQQRWLSKKVIPKQKGAGFMKLQNVGLKNLALDNLKVVTRTLADDMVWVDERLKKVFKVSESLTLLLPWGSPIMLTSINVLFSWTCALRNRSSFLLLNILKGLFCQVVKDADGLLDWTEVLVGFILYGPLILVTVDKSSI
ncbi:hypothetical protein Tco_1153576 [Tanacetum coccineum]